jgi:hypothetical protein
MSIAKRVLVVFLCFAVLAYPQGNTFTRVRYNGGSVATKVDPKDWGNRLIVTPEAIVLELKDRQRVEIPPKSVTSLSYGQEAHRRVGTMIALAILVAPVAIFGLFHKTRLHFIGVQYKTPDGKTGGILLQGDKDNYRAIVVALQGVTGAPVIVAEKEREFVPVGAATQVVNESNQVSATPQTQPEPMKATPVTTPVVPQPDPVRVSQPATIAPQAEPVKITTATVSPRRVEAGALVDVTFASNPPGARVYFNGMPFFSTPFVTKLQPEKYPIKMTLAGYPDWETEVTVEAGKPATVVAQVNSTTGVVLK